MELISKADLHLHTTYSDGTASVPHVLERAAASDLKVIAVTDHDAIAGAHEAARLADHFGIEVIVGEEVSTREGHLLALFIEDFLPPGRPAAETIAAIHAQGGLCIAPHPYDWAVVSLGRWGLRRRLATDWPIDAIEVFNASLSGPRRGCNKVAQRVAAELGVPAVGGSDSHSLATLGRGYTTFTGSTANDLYRAIQTGEVGWGGQLWSTTQYIQTSWLTIRQRNMWGALKLLLADLPFWSQPRMTNEAPRRSILPAEQHAHV